MNVKEDYCAITCVWSVSLRLIRLFLVFVFFLCVFSAGWVEGGTHLHWSEDLQCRLWLWRTSGICIFIEMILFHCSFLIWQRLLKVRCPSWCNPLPQLFDQQLDVPTRASPKAVGPGRVQCFVQGHLWTKGGRGTNCFANLLITLPAKLKLTQIMYLPVLKKGQYQTN